MRRLLITAFVMTLGACGPAPEAETHLLAHEAGPDLLRPVEDGGEALPQINEAVQSKLDALGVILEANSLNRLSRLANSEPAFVSNFAGEGHRTHWDLLRRTGFDPLAQLQTLFEGPYGVKQVGEELWYIWPDLAALDPEELVPERLSFSDRARLLELVGEPGIERIRQGQGYPGMRTAIADDGRWLYFVHETEDENAEAE